MEDKAMQTRQGKERKVKEILGMARQGKSRHEKENLCMESQDKAMEFMARK
jgi:hypothetical protein